MFLQPVNRRLDVRGAAGSIVTVLSEPDSGAPGPTVRGPDGARAAAGTVLELAVPLAVLGAGPGDPIGFFVSVASPGHSGGQDAERYPAQRPIRLIVPGENFSGENWRA